MEFDHQYSMHKQYAKLLLKLFCNIYAGLDRVRLFSVVSFRNFRRQIKKMSS